MANIKRANASSITKSGVAIADVPDAPTIGAVTDGGAGAATVAFTAAVTGGTPTSYTVTSSPDSLTATGASSPLTVSGLAIGTSYTFTVRATNSTGTGAASSASSSFSPSPYAAFESIVTTTLGSGSNSITFSSIPQTYKHLQVRIWSPFDWGGSSTTWNMRVNGATNSANYRTRGFYANYSTGDGAPQFNGTNSQADRLFMSGAGGASNFWPGANFPGVAIYDLYDYTKSDQDMTMSTVFGIGGTSSSYSQAIANGGAVFSQFTSGITSLTFLVDGGTYGATSIFALYGIKG